jgi:hypothetical protein
MSRITTPLAIVLIAAIGACAVEPDDGSVVLQNDADDSKSDSIFGKQLNVRLRSDKRPSAGITADTVEVVSVSSDALTISGTRYVLRVPANADVEVAVRVPATFTTTDMRFLLGIRRTDGDAFTPIELAGAATSAAGQTRQVTVNYFEAIKLDTFNNQLTFWNENTPSNGLTAPVEGLRGHAFELGVFAFPSSTWGSLKGTYDYELAALCDGEVCK